MIYESKEPTVQKGRQGDMSHGRIWTGVVRTQQLTQGEWVRKGSQKVTPKLRLKKFFKS